MDLHKIKNGIASVAAGTVLALSASPAIGQEVCGDGSEPLIMRPGSGAYDYSGAAQQHGQPFVESLGYTGQGTAIAQLEATVLAYFFRFVDDRPPPFGACKTPENRPPDHWGFAPESDPAYPEYPCKVAWVMCLNPDLEDSVPVEETATGAARGLTACDLIIEGINQAGDVDDTIGGHATTGALGAVHMAPDTKIIAIAHGHGATPLHSRAAFRWLITPISKYRGEGNKKRNDSHYYLSNDNGDAVAWGAYWRETFGTQSPAEKFNIVAASYTDELSLKGANGFSGACGAVNPDIRQTNMDGDPAIDMVDNCVHRPNQVQVNVGTAEEPFYLADYPDADKDGRGNKCDADFNNDGVFNGEDRTIYRAVREDFANFKPPFDLNEDGVTGYLDKLMFRDAMDFNGDGTFDNDDHLYYKKTLQYTPIGLSFIDLLDRFEQDRNPGRYLQDRLYELNATVGDISRAKYADIGHEFRDLRAAGVMPVVPVGNNGWSNGLTWPSCYPGAFSVAGIRHVADKRLAIKYDPETGSYDVEEDWFIRGNAVQDPEKPLLVTHGPGRAWLPVVPKAPTTEEAPHCPNDPLSNGGGPSSFIPLVTIGAIAAIKSPGFAPELTPDEIEQLLWQTDRQAHVRRNCNVTQILAQDEFDPELDYLFCDPDSTDYEQEDTWVNYSLPALDLAGAYKKAKRMQSFGDEAFSDIDNDGIFDVVDNCSMRANTRQRDSDGDGYGDVCDGDFDNNGMVDYLDSIAFTEDLLDTNNPAGDFDSNGVVDSYDYDYMLNELAMLPPGPSSLDADADGIANHIDNCRWESNGPWTVYETESAIERNQVDSDRDFIGNVCDGDLNNDGLVNLSDQYRLENKISQNVYYVEADYNADGVVDAVDLDWFKENLLLPSKPVPGPSDLCLYDSRFSQANCLFYD